MLSKFKIEGAIKLSGIQSFAASVLKSKKFSKDWICRKLFFKKVGRTNFTCRLFNKNAKLSSLWIYSFRSKDQQTVICTWIQFGLLCYQAKYSDFHLQSIQKVKIWQILPLISNALHFPSGDNILRHWNMRQTQGFKTRSVPHTKHASQTPSLIIS